MNIDDIINRLNELNEGSLIPYYAYNQLMDMCFEIDEEIGKLQTQLTQLKAEKCGEWVKLKRTEIIKNTKSTHYCSKCENMADREYNMNLKCYEDKLTNHCPNCGAKMKKEENQ